MEVVHHSVPPDALLHHTAALGEARLFWVRSPGFSVRCAPAARDGVLKLVAPVEGTLTLKQAGRQVRLDPGVFSWVDADEPFEVIAAEGRVLQLRLPAEMVLHRHHDLDVRSAVVRGLEHPGDRMIVHLLQQLALEGPALSAEACACGLVALLHAFGMGPRRVLARSMEQRIARVLQEIEARLSDFALHAEAIAEHEGVSRRYLDGLFREHLGRTVAEHIRRRRLELAASDLTTTQTTAAEIARRYGFRDASHFGKTFRGHFGATPATYRKTHRPSRGGTYP